MSPIKKQKEARIRGPRTWKLAVVWLALTGGVSFEVSSFAQTPQDAKDLVGAEVYTEPKFKKGLIPKFPTEELERESNGLVYVQFMIDPSGNTYEHEIISSSGSRLFERAAVEAVQQWTFEPATFGAKPIDASLVVPFIFTMRDGAAFAEAFRKNYVKVGRALNAGDKANAEKGLKKLAPQNLYEDALIGLAQHSYASKWEGEQQQLDALRRAVGVPPSQRYLSKDAFVAALQAMFPLEVRARDYASALATWKLLQAENLDAETLTKLRPVAERVEALRADTKPYAVSGSMPKGTWSYKLFRNKFRINVESGRISQIKLYCEKKFVLFQFNPQLEYTVNEKFGQCSMMAFGDAETTFKLIQ